MATKIRLKRIGRRNRPFFRMVVMDSRKRRDVEAGSDGGQEESPVNDTAEAPVDEGDSEESTEDEASSTEEE